MDINENKNVDNVAKNDNPKNEQKVRHNRRNNNNNDLWIHVDAHNSETNKFMTLLTGISTLAAISLVVVSLIQHNQTIALTKQNDTLIEKYSQAMTQMNEQNAEALTDIEAGMNAIVNSIDNITINNQGVSISPNVDIQQEAPVAPVDDSAFMGVLVMNDGTAVTPLGLRIAGIYNNSPAANAGLRAGDIIMSIDNITIDSFDTMSGIIDTKSVGDTITLRFARTQDNTVYFETVELVLDSMANYDTSTTETPTQE